MSTHDPTNAPEGRAPLFKLSDYEEEVSIYANKFLEEYPIGSEDWIGVPDVFEYIMESLSPSKRYGGELEPVEHDWLPHNEAISKLLQIAGAALAAAHALEEVDDQLQLDREGE